MLFLYYLNVEPYSILEMNISNPHDHVHFVVWCDMHKDSQQMSTHVLHVLLSYMQNESTNLLRIFVLYISHLVRFICPNNPYGGTSSPTCIVPILDMYSVREHPCLGRHFVQSITNRRRATSSVARLHGKQFNQTKLLVTSLK